MSELIEVELKCGTCEHFIDLTDFLEENYEVEGGFPWDGRCTYNPKSEYFKKSHQCSKWERSACPRGA